MIVFIINAFILAVGFACFIYISLPLSVVPLMKGKISKFVNWGEFTTNISKVSGLHLDESAGTACFGHVQCTCNVRVRSCCELFLEVLPDQFDRCPH